MRPSKNVPLGAGVPGYSRPDDKSKLAHLDEGRSWLVRIALPSESLGLVASATACKGEDNQVTGLVFGVMQGCLAPDHRSDGAEPQEGGSRSNCPHQAPREG
jgi:hypothetical protein